MMLKMTGKLLILLLGVVLIAVGGAEAGAQSRSELDVALKELKGRYENARKEMVLLSKQLSDVLYKENSLENRKAYADRVLALRDLMESLANQRKSLGQRIAETPSTPPRFRLVAIKGPKTGRKNDVEIEWSKDSPGVTTRYYRGEAWDGPRGRVTNVGPGRGGDDTKYRSVHIGSVSLMGVPTEIVLGQPFEFSVKAARRNEYVNGSPSCDVRSWGGFSQKVGAIFYAMGLGGVAKGKKDLRLFCDEAKRMPHPNPNYRAYQKAALQDDIAVAVRMVPTKVRKNRKGYPTNYYYRMEVSSNGADTTGIHGKEKNVLDFDAEKFMTDQQGFLRPGNKHFKTAKKKRLKFSVSPSIVMTKDTVVLEYAPVTKDEPFITSIPPFVEPPDFGKPTGTGLGGDESGSDGSGTAPTASNAVGAGSSGTNGSGNVAALTPGDTGSGSGTSEGRGGAGGAPIPGLTATGSGGSYTPGDIKPGNPTIATFMREWIAVAEPPENADPGYRLRYNNRGTKVGTAPTGIMTDRHDTGGFDPNFLWTNKQGLASLNHCTLGDFVLKRANGSASPGCASGSRPSASGLPRLAGMSVSQAKKTLTDIGFKVRLRPGKPAPRQKLFGKIERQSPKAGAKTKKGRTVTLFVHTEPKAGPVTVPDLLRLSSRDAKAALEQARLKAKLRPGKQAATAALTGKVGRQSPPAGTQVKRDQTVTLYILAPPVRGVTVPDVARMSESQAISALGNAGFKPTIRGGPAAPERSLSAKVQGTEPRAGATAGKDSSVVITVYGKYQPTAAERRRETAEQERRQRAERARRTAVETERRAAVERERQDRAQRDAAERARQASVERARRDAAERARRQAAERSRQDMMNTLRTLQEQNARREQQRRNAVEAERQRELTRQRELQRQRAAREQQRRQQQQRIRSRPSTTTSGLTPTPRSSRAAVERARRCASNSRRSGNRVICSCSGYRYDSRRRTCVKTPTSQRPAPKPRTPPRTAEKPPPPPNMRHLSCGELERLGYKCPTSTMTPGGQICIYGLC